MRLANTTVFYKYEINVEVIFRWILETFEMMMAEFKYRWNKTAVNNWKLNAV
jgi:hypothetical protein